MLPLLLKLNPETFKIKMSAEKWTQLKPFVTFRKINKDEDIEILGQYIVLVEGLFDT